MIYNWYDKGKQRGWSRNWANYCNEQKPEHLCFFFPLSTKRTNAWIFFHLSFSVPAIVQPR